MTARPAALEALARDLADREREFEQARDKLARLQRDKQRDKQRDEEL